MLPKSDVHIVLGDESTPDSKGGTPFYVYACVAIPGENFHELNQRISEIRNENDIADDRYLKFALADKGDTPERVWIKVRYEILEIAVKLGSMCVISYCHKGIRADPNPANSIRILRNRAISQVSTLMQELDSCASIFLDQIGDKNEHATIRDLATRGFSITATKRQVLLPRIHAVGITASQSTPALCLPDYCAGLFNFWRSEKQTNEKRQVAIKNLAPILWTTSSPKLTASGYGLVQSPEKIYNPDLTEPYRAVHTELDEFLQQNPTQE